MLTLCVMLLGACSKPVREICVPASAGASAAAYLE